MMDISIASVAHWLALPVTVNPPPGISLPFYPRSITAGATAGTNYYANLGDANHGGVTVTISSGDPTVALVAPNNTTTPGSASVDVFVPNGETLAYYRLDALEGAAEGQEAHDYGRRPLFLLSGRDTNGHNDFTIGH